jgi:hypothetical protein
MPDEPLFQEAEHPAEREEAERKAGEAPPKKPATRKRSGKGTRKT